MKVETALQEIDEANSEFLSSREYEADRAAYERTLETVQEVAHGDAVDEVLRYIAGTIRTDHERPSPDDVDEFALGLLSKRGFSVPEDSHLRE